MLDDRLRFKSTSITDIVRPYTITITITIKKEIYKVTIYINKSRKYLKRKLKRCGKMNKTKRGRKIVWTMDSKIYLLFLLKEKGLTIQEIANELGVSKPTISAEIENGVDKTNFSRITRGAANTYSPLRSTVNSAIKAIGEDGIKALLESPDEVIGLIETLKEGEVNE